MATESNKSKKLYYSIQEVGQIIGVSESTLRFWEKEFPHIKPRTAGQSNVRQYTEKNIEDLKVIYNLIKVRGFKIAAAREYLKNNREGVDKSSEVITLLQDTLSGYRTSRNISICYKALRTVFGDRPVVNFFIESVSPLFLYRICLTSLRSSTFFNRPMMVLTSSRSCTRSSICPLKIPWSAVNATL